MYRAYGGDGGARVAAEKAEDDAADKRSARRALRAIEDSASGAGPYDRCSEGLHGRT